MFACFKREVNFFDFVQEISDFVRGVCFAEKDIAEDVSKTLQDAKLEDLRHDQ